MMKKDIRDDEKMKRRIMLLMLLVLLALALPLTAGTETKSGTFSASEPTCTESGYSVIEEQGVIHFEEIPAIGHQFSSWMIDQEANAKTHICQRCGYQETIRLSSIPEDSIPKLEMNGSLDGIGKKSKVVLSVTYTDSEQSFQCYGILTLQGHSTFGLEKKNYTLRFYDDATGEKKHRVVFRNWNKEHKYILKANYIDVSQCRNLVGAEIWSSIVQTRTVIPDRLSCLPTFGAVDSFPIAVYLNGDFYGLYTLNLHKDDDLYQMKKGKQEALLICNAQTADEALFRSAAMFADDYTSDWEVEFCGTEDASWAQERFNQFISFVMNSSDQEFREHLDDYLDVDAAIDYLIFIYALGLKDSGAKNLVILSFGDQWIPSAYDMDEAFGLDAEDSAYRNPEAFLPSLSNGTWDSGTGSLLWDRILNHFFEQLKERYLDLRGGPLSDDSLLSRYHSYISQIPESFFDYDWYLYPGRLFRFWEMEQQIEQYIPARMAILDELFEGGRE